MTRISFFIFRLGLAPAFALFGKYKQVNRVYLEGLSLI